MKLSTYLFFAGNCKEAIAFYERVLEAKTIFAMPFAGSPAESMAPEGWGDKILHATMELGGQTVMLSDMLPGRGEATGGFSLSLEVGSVDEAKTRFAALSEGGTVLMAMEPTFWSPMFGMCRDRYGTPWQVSAAGQP